MIDLDNVKVVVQTDAISDDYLIFKGFKQLWFTYDGKAMWARRRYLPLISTRDSAIMLWSENTEHITTVGLGWR